MSEHLDHDAAQEFVHDHFGNRATRLEPLGEGEWSRAFAFDLDGRSSVIRFGRNVEDFYKDQIMAGYRSAAVPIPRVVEIDEARDGFFAVSDRAYGEFVDALDGGGMQRVLPGLFQAMDEITKIQVEDGKGFGLWGPDRVGQFPSWSDALLSVADERPRIAGWRAALETSPSGIAPFNNGLEVLRKLSRELPNERALVHNDLLNRNVLVEEDQITAVFDWGNAIYGDPLYDAATLLYWWEWYPQWSAIDIKAEVNRHWAGTSDLERRLLACQIHIGLEHQSYNAFLGRWDDVDRNVQQTNRLLSRATS
jgi:hygromycin-B 4-O-kinase